MKKTVLVISLLAIVIIGAYYIKAKDRSLENGAIDMALAIKPRNNQPIEIADIPELQFVSPLDNPRHRIKLKKFGDYITPENSPVNPERFQGFHTGVDFEVYPEELNSAVMIRAMCAGEILEKKWVSGYGGILIQSCEINSEPVTVLYGHLNLAGISAKKGDLIIAGQEIGTLGADTSQETDYERKHLHLAIHQGKVANLKGYVSEKEELGDWLDPCELICN